MTTAGDLVTGAFQAARVYANGETILPADLAQGFLLLNQMMDSWSNESLTTFALLEQSFPLVVGQSAYTIGTVGSPDINATRPIRIHDGPGAAYIKDSNNNQYPVEVIPKNKWNELWNISAVTSNLPDTLYYDNQFPLGVLNVYPTYAGGLGVTLYFDSFAQLTEFASLTGIVNLPPGYEKTIQSNLALDLEPYFPTAQITPSLARSAAQAKGNIKRSNRRENIAEMEKVLMARGTIAYNIWSDSYR